jgi:hypothetical protein
MARRVTFVQRKTGYDIDRGPSWIAWVEFNATWKTARVHGRELRRIQGNDANFQDVGTEEWFWLSGPKRDRSDTRYGPEAPTIDADARAAYEAFIDGAPLPGRDGG